MDKWFVVLLLGASCRFDVRFDCDEGTCTTAGSDSGAAGTGTGATTTGDCGPVGGAIVCECGDGAADIDGDGVPNASDADADGDAR